MQIEAVAALAAVGVAGLVGRVAARPGEDDGLTAMACNDQIMSSMVAGRAGSGSGKFQRVVGVRATEFSFCGNQ